MKEHKPLYPYSFEESERNGEMVLYKQSHNENIACALTCSPKDATIGP